MGTEGDDITRGARPWLPGLAVGIAAGLLVLGGVAAVMALRGGDEPAGSGSASQPLTSTPGAGIEPPGLPATSPVEPTGSVAPTPTQGAQVGGEAPAGRSSDVAFRLGQTVYVARADGSAPAPVGRFPEGPYVLSPDGQALAVVTEGSLSIVDVRSGHRVDVGEALGSGALMGECPVWTPDSRHILYARESARGTEVRRVGRDGSGDRRLTDGSSPTVSADGRVVAVIGNAPDAAEGVIRVSRDGSRFRSVSVREGRVTALAASGDRLWFGVLSPDGVPSVRSFRPDGGAPARVTGAPAGTPRTAWGMLRLSPDGADLAAAALGDDQVSRVYVVGLRTGEQTLLSVRRDTYLKGWSADGGFLYLIEGNAYQGESTALIRVGPDGSGRRTLVTGAQ